VVQNLSSIARSPFWRRHGKDAIFFFHLEQKILQDLIELLCPLEKKETNPRNNLDFAWFIFFKLQNKSKA